MAKRLLVEMILIILGEMFLMKSLKNNQMYMNENVPTSYQSECNVI